MRVTVNVDTNGPLFDGRAEVALLDFEEALLDDVAGQGLANVQMILDQSIRHPTPYYETQVRTERVGTDRSVNDRGVIYGRWLEGTSSRNRTTRFKGYAAFRRATQQLRARVPEMAEAVLARYIGRMGG